MSESEVKATMREIGRLCTAIAEERRETLARFGEAVSKNLRDMQQRRAEERIAR